MPPFKKSYKLYKYRFFVAALHRIARMRAIAIKMYFYFRCLQRDGLQFEFFRFLRFRILTVVFKMPKNTKQTLPQQVF